MINTFEEKPLFLKWEDDIVGVIHPDNNLSIKQPAYNLIVSTYFKNKN